MVFTGLAIVALMGLKGLRHCFSICIEINGNNWYCFSFKKAKNFKEKFQRVKMLPGI